MKIAVIGAGSFVFGPSVLSQAILEHRLDGVELALMDVDAASLEGMAGVGAAMARRAEVDIAISTHTERAGALDGADFVICAAARQIHARFELDASIVDRYAPGHLVTEFGGVAGISYSLRQIVLIEEIAADIRRHCPAASLLVSSNPLPRVCQAAHESGVTTVGFCSVSLEGFAMLWRLFEGDRLRYPFAAARERWDVTMAGLNHFSWIVAARDRASGRDLLPEIRVRLAAGASSGSPRSDRLCLETGYLLVPNDNHTRDFLPPDGVSGSREAPTHGSAADRQQRLALLRGIADGTAPVEDLLGDPSWERPMDLIAAIAFGRSASFNSLNLVNDGQIPELPRGVFVETPAAATPNGPVPSTVPLPAALLPLCRRTAEISDTIVRAARERDRSLVHRAIELDPTVLDKPAGIRAIDECLRAHADILPVYS